MRAAAKQGQVDTVLKVVRERNREREREGGREGGRAVPTRDDIMHVMMSSIPMTIPYVQ